MTTDAGPTALRRSLSLPLLLLYGLGTIVGAGIYVLTGEVAGEAGMGAPIAFVLAAVIAGFTAFSYAELGARFPRAAGEPFYLRVAFRERWPAALAGWGVIVVGTVSAATLARGFHGYLGLFVDLPAPVVLTAIVLTVGGIAAWGIRESAWAAAAVTCVELGGLAWVALHGAWALETLPERWPELLPGSETVAWTGLGAGAFLAFYAFTGFEDMVNVAEEVRDPGRTLPKAILGALTIATLLYFVIVLVAVLAVPLDALSGSAVPLAAVIGAGGGGTVTIGLISLVAVINGALIQIIMGARVLYGISQDAMAPAAFSRVHPVRRTPVRATLAVTGAVLLFALALPLGQLARLTSLITLLVFASVNGALWYIRRRDGARPGTVSWPLWIPVCGLVLSLLLVAMQVLSMIA